MAFGWLVAAIIMAITSSACLGRAPSI